MIQSSNMSSVQLRSFVSSEGTVELSLVDVPLATPGAQEVLVRVQAAPLNPTDIMSIFGAADVATAKVGGTAARPVVTLRIPEVGLQSMAARFGQSSAAGREGAGVVVAAGSSAAAQALLGKTVAVMGDGLFSDYQLVSVDQCMALPVGRTAVEGAAAFINPLTALGMIETMRLEGHKALVHTAAASNLGQMLNRLCQKDGIGLVNIVRRSDQVALLRTAGARHVCDSSAVDFQQRLVDAIDATGATLAFDATGGGKLAGQILSAMESSLRNKAASASALGSNVRKHVYQYGRLEPGATEYNNDFGFDWGIGGWVIFSFLQRIGAEAVSKLKQRVMNELTTTFASQYSREISLTDMLKPEVITDYHRRATGGKFLVRLVWDIGGLEAASR